MFIGTFGTVFTQQSLIAKFGPDLIHLPTTVGEHCIGDGIKMGEAVGAMAIDLEWVQVHPAGCVKPDDPDAKLKFLAADAFGGGDGLGGQEFLEFGPVILCIGGFGNVFAHQSRLAKVRPVWIRRPTTVVSTASAMASRSPRLSGRRPLT